MKKIDFGQTIQILANLGVIAGIVFLAFEISQNTAMMQAQMNQGRAETAMAQAESLYNSEFIPDIFQTIREGGRLTSLQSERFRIYLRAFNRNQDNLLSQYRQGLLGEEVYRSIRDAVRVEVAEKPPAREIWRATKQSYSDPYIELVDEVIAGYESSVAGSEQSRLHDSDREAINALLEENEAATNRRDSAGVAATFLPDAELWIAGGPRFSGLVEIRQNEENFYRTPGLQNWTATVESIRFITEDVALVDSEAITTLDSGESRSRANIVVVRTEDGWRMATVYVMGVESE